MARLSSLFLTLLVIVIALDCSLRPSIAVAKQARVSPKQSRALLVSPANILDKISNKIKQRPSLSSKELACYANQLLEEKGFDYAFDVCDIVKQPKQIPSYSTATQRFTVALVNGRNLSFKFMVGSAQDSLCGECWSDIPSVQVTRKEMLVIVEGKRYRLKRPASFVLDEAELVDESLKKVHRRWVLPYQTVPFGISPDGTKLYVGHFHNEHPPEGLVLELSEDGRIKFKARGDVQSDEGVSLENYPRDPRNDYLSFIRFRAGKKSYVVRFSGPCT